ncbi:ATP-binding protein [Sphaerisporangium dianthi]|uniref:ATP-binding protein n=1 Tax=Sphaerisporangium dianthi TaxID=1436120 RepID=A0ABV9CIC1_9ACTN
MIQTPDGLRAVCWELPDNLEMIGKTRRLVKDVLANWTLSALADDVVLVVGELLANAVTYGQPPIRLSMWAGTDRLCLRVTDHGPEQPRTLKLGLESLHGRGLAIVAALAHENGVTRPIGRPGKTVWACWRLPARAAEDAFTRVEL